ncbi:MAG: septal ring lytic transglycosylase RlpA family protein [Leptospiraceae bacterium]|nr:septal ring lytic transglycosylase RlpA family protein [Leptospiraceae bacterium]
MLILGCRAPQARNNPGPGQLQAEAQDPALQDGNLEARSVAAVSEGYAAWYGKELHGRPTASGELFDMNKLTAAHRDYPMHSLVLVKNLENGKKTVVKVNDRGPYVEGRIIDVSYAAARELGFAEKGVARVQIELIQAGEDNFLAKATPEKSTIARRKADNDDDLDILEPDLDAEEKEDPQIKSAKSKKEKLIFLDGKKPRGYTVQVGAFKKKANAERHRDEILESYPEKAFIATDGKWHYVCLGDFKTRKQAKAFLKKLAEDGVDVMYRGKIG